MVRVVKLKNISLIVIGAIAVLAIAACLWASIAMARPVPSVTVGPTAYVPGASPATAPGMSVETRNVSTPTPGATAVPAPSVTVTARPVAAGGGATAAKIVNYGTDKDTFKRGERATGFITIQNTGGMTINDITASVSAKAQLPVIGSTAVGSKDYTFNNLNIKPGETKRVEFIVDIPSEYKGVSTAGTYNLDVNVKTGSANIGSFSKSVKVT
jgi:hypothetical protein